MKRQKGGESELVFFISHANVLINPEIPVPEWKLSDKGVIRHKEFNKNQFVRNIEMIFCSQEQKAIDGAKILSDYLNIEFKQIESLGEMDRSSTGYLGEEEFQETANMFFANPNESIRGWEKATEAQERIVTTTKHLINQEQKKGNIAIISHGGVGSLLLCYLLNKNISREFDQPFNGGGNYFCFERETLKVIHKWKDISKID